MPPSLEVPPASRGEPRSALARFPLQAGGTLRLKGVGFLRACLLAALPSSASLPSCERAARAPSTRDAGNAGVSPALPTAREKPTPLRNLKEGVSFVRVFAKFGVAIGISHSRLVEVLKRPEDIL